MIKARPEAVAATCPSCGAKWIDAAGLARDAELVPSKLAQIPARPPRACPACTGRLERVWDAESKLEIDRCPSCHGVFLDPGELETLRSFRDARLAARAAMLQRVSAMPPPEPENYPVSFSGASEAGIQLGVTLFQTVIEALADSLED
jgi:Zn-finger nucleic acid-binding protein